MRLIDFLNEKSYVKKIKIEKLLKVLEKNCKNNWEDFKKKGPRIWRGDKNIKKEGIFLFDSDEERKSANTFNYYTILFSDVLPSWEGIPKRTKALVCTTDDTKAGNYAGGDNNTFAVIPYDNLTIAETNTDDIWHIIQQTVKKNDFFRKPDDLSEFNMDMKKLISDSKDDIIKFMETDVYTTLKKNKKIFKDLMGPKFVLEMIAKYAFKTDFKDFDEYRNFIKSYDSLLDENKTKLSSMKMKDIFDYFLSPKMMKITTCNYNQLKGKQEVWFSGPAVMISKTLLNELKEHY